MAYLLWSESTKGRPYIIPLAVPFEEHFNSTHDNPDITHDSPHTTHDYPTQHTIAFNNFDLKMKKTSMENVPPRLLSSIPTRLSCVCSLKIP